MSVPALYDVVESLRGHDRGRLYLVTGIRGDRLLLCDGKSKRLAAPKCKSPKHVRVIVGAAGMAATDREIRKAIALAASEAAAKEEMLLGER